MRSRTGAQRTNLRMCTIGRMWSLPVGRKQAAASLGSYISRQFGAGALTWRQRSMGRLPNLAVYNRMPSWAEFRFSPVIAGARLRARTPATKLAQTYVTTTTEGSNTTLLGRRDGAPLAIGHRAACGPRCAGCSETRLGRPRATERETRSSCPCWRNAYQDEADFKKMYHPRPEGRLRQVMPGLCL